MMDSAQVSDLFDAASKAAIAELPVRARFNHAQNAAEPPTSTRVWTHAYKLANVATRSSSGCALKEPSSAGGRVRCSMRRHSETAALGVCATFGCHECTASTHRRSWVLLAVLALGACSNGAAPLAQGSAGSDPVGADSVGVTPVGASYEPECQVDADCVDVSDHGPLGTYELIGAECKHISAVYELPVCECSMQLSPTTLHGPVAADAGVFRMYPGNRPKECSELTRSGACLYCASEFPGCDIGDPRSCDAICADMTARRDRDYRKSYEVRTRLARCVAEHTNVCRVITEIDGQCVVGRFGDWLPAPVDCSLSDEDLSKHFGDPMDQPCAPPATVACSRSGDCPRGLACTNGVCESCELRCTDGVEPGTSECEGGDACAEGEACAGGTCVPAVRAACGDYEDRFVACPEDESCLVTGISSAGRGNESASSFCTN